MWKSNENNFVRYRKLKIPMICNFSSQNFKFKGGRYETFTKYIEKNILLNRVLTKAKVEFF